MNELPQASIATTLHAVTIRLGASVPTTTQTPPNTDPPTATERGIGEGQHLHGAGEERYAAHELVAKRGGVASVAQAHSRVEDDCRATSCISGGGLEESANVQRILCIPTSPLVATVRPSDWQQGAIIPREVAMLRACGRAQPQGGAVGTR